MLISRINRGRVVGLRLYKLKDNLAYVAKADGKEVRVYSDDETIEVDLNRLGFNFDSQTQMYIKLVGGIPEKANLFSELRDLGVCFSDGREWNPGELFEYFREQGLVGGKFKKISWQSSKDFTVREL